jgi:surface antigen/peptidoglycan hydrolase CwlO-like protein
MKIPLERGMAMRFGKASSQLFRKTCAHLGMAAVLFCLASPVARADQYDDQISQLKAQAAQQQAEASALHAKANDYLGKVRQLNSQIAAAQTKISLTELQSRRTSAAIDQAKADMAAKKTALGQTIKAMYLDSALTPLEMLASSRDISEFFNQQQYQDKVKEQIQTTLAALLATEAKLKQQQAELARVVAEQRVQRDQLAASRAEVNQLRVLAATDAAAADSQVRDSNARITQLKAAQAEMWRRIQAGSNGNGGGSVGSFTYRNWTGNQGACGGGYGYSSARGYNYCHFGHDALVDEWALYSRECVSYAAWAVHYREGIPLGSFGGQGNAYQWPSTLSGRYRIDNNPSGSVVAVVAPQSMIGGVGHIMMVEHVYGDGWIKVSQYNWGNTGQYSVMDLKVVSGLQFIHFR